MIGLCVHSLRATAATNALSHEADIAKVQEWLGHANVSTTRLYDRRKTQARGQPDIPRPVLDRVFAGIETKPHSPPTRICPSQGSITTFCGIPPH